MGITIKRVILSLLLVVALAGQVFAQWGGNDPAWFDDDATDLDNLLTNVATVDGVADSVDLYVSQPYTVEDTALPQSTTDTLFTINGPFVIEEVIGEVTTVIQAQADNTKLSILNGGTTTDICANLDINAKAAGSFMTITGTFANAMVNNAAKTPISGAQAAAIRTPPGTSYVILTCAASNSGAITLSITGHPLAQGVTCVPDAAD